jgi:hypothetical protein
LALGLLAKNKNVIPSPGNLHLFHLHNNADDCPKVVKILGLDFVDSLPVCCCFLKYTDMIHEEIGEQFFILRLILDSCFINLSCFINH